MRVPVRLLAAALCAVGACAVHAQGKGTYLPGEFYPLQVTPLLVPPTTNVLGAGSLGGPPQDIHPGSLGRSATDVARAFHFADLNQDGGLTQVEAGRIGIGVSSFNEMDRNNDGQLSPGEIDDVLR